MTSLMREVGPTAYNSDTPRTDRQVAVILGGVAAETSALVAVSFHNPDEYWNAGEINAAIHDLQKGQTLSDFADSYYPGICNMRSGPYGTYHKIPGHGQGSNRIPSRYRITEEGLEHRAVGALLAQTVSGSEGPALRVALGEPQLTSSENHVPAIVSRLFLLSRIAYLADFDIKDTYAWYADTDYHTLYHIENVLERMASSGLLEVVSRVSQQTNPVYRLAKQYKPVVRRLINLSLAVYNNDPGLKDEGEKCARALLNDPKTCRNLIHKVGSATLRSAEKKVAHSSNAAIAYQLLSTSEPTTFDAILEALGLENFNINRRRKFTEALHGHPQIGCRIADDGRQLWFARNHSIL